MRTESYVLPGDRPDGWKDARWKAARARLAGLPRRELVRALADIHASLDGEEWGCDACDSVALAVERLGLALADTEPDADLAPIAPAPRAPRESARSTWRKRWRNVRAEARLRGIDWTRAGEDAALFCLLHRTDELSEFRPGAPRLAGRLP